MKTNLTELKDIKTDPIKCALEGIYGRLGDREMDQRTRRLSSGNQPRCSSSLIIRERKLKLQ